MTKEKKAYEPDGDDGIAVFEAVAAVLLALPDMPLVKIPPLFDLAKSDEDIRYMLSVDDLTPPESVDGALEDALEAVMEARAAMRDGSGDLHPACYAKCRIIAARFEQLRKLSPDSKAIAMGLKAARADAMLDKPKAVCTKHTKHRSPPPPPKGDITPRNEKVFERVREALETYENRDRDNPDPYAEGEAEQAVEHVIRAIACEGGNSKNDVRLQFATRMIDGWGMESLDFVGVAGFLVRPDEGDEDEGDE